VDPIQLIPAAFERALQFHPSQVIQLHGVEALEFHDGGFHGLLCFGEGLFLGIGGGRFRRAIAAGCGIGVAGVSVELIDPKTSWSRRG